MRVLPVLTVQTCEQERLGKKGSDLRDGFQTAYHSFMVTMPVVELGTGGGRRRREVGVGERELCQPQL